MSVRDSKKAMAIKSSAPASVSIITARRIGLARRAVWSRIGAVQTRNAKANTKIERAAGKEARRGQGLFGIGLIYHRGTCEDDFLWMSLKMAAPPCAAKARIIWAAFCGPSRGNCTS